MRRPKQLGLVTALEADTTAMAAAAPLNSGGDSHPAWSPDGGTMAFARVVPQSEEQLALEVYPRGARIPGGVPGSRALEKGART
jgi:WD40-like Beta Propeller Repeat